MDKNKYLNPESIAKLDSMSLRARLVVEGYLLGQHKSPYHGFSVEFAEHRAYGHGDEIRHIDWKLYGKTDRYYIKRFEEETNLRSHILIDTSQSMKFKSKNITKLDYASYLAAALTHLMLSQKDGIGLILFDEKIKKFIPPRASKTHAKIIMETLDTIKCGNDTRIKTTLDYMAERIKKRGLVILISDLMDNPDEVLMGLNHFRHNKQEVIVFHIMDRQESEFNYSDRIQFKDMETGEVITTDPWHIRNEYQNQIEKFKRKYQRGCRNQRIDYIPIYTDQSLDIALNEYLNKRKKSG